MVSAQNLAYRGITSGNAQCIAYRGFICDIIIDIDAWIEIVRFTQNIKRNIQFYMER